ncbi:PIG-L deacetylase family protein [Nanoarchaeota archaeon]
MKKETILVLCAHNDDQVIGAGGTLAKYAKQGCIVKSIIFSFGASSHPHLKSELIIKTRIKESLQADRILKGSGVAYLGLKEGKFKEEIKKKKVKERLQLLIKKEKPSKIFTHSINDPHGDHKAVFNLVMEMLNVIDCEVYTFEIWTLFRLHNRYKPKLFEDISDTFDSKIKAFKSHKSQKISIVNLILSVYFKAAFNGWKYNCKYGEVFNKLK